MRIFFIAIVMSMVLGFSVALGINKLASRHIEQSPQQTESSEINLTDQLLIRIEKRLENVERQLDKSLR